MLNTKNWRDHLGIKWDLEATEKITLEGIGRWIHNHYKSPCDMSVYRESKWEIKPEVLKIGEGYHEGMLDFYQRQFLHQLRWSCDTCLWVLLCSELHLLIVIVINLLYWTTHVSLELGLLHYSDWSFGYVLKFYL